jgi:hypothetical protein
MWKLSPALMVGQGSGAYRWNRNGKAHVTIGFDWGSEAFRPVFAAIEISRNFAKTIPSLKRP